MTVTNYLAPHHFLVNLSRTPGIEYTCQVVDIPGLDLNPAMVPTPFKPVNVGGGVNHSPLSITFKVDESLANYMELFDWIIAVGMPKSTTQYVDIPTTDASVTILNNAGRAVKEILFTDLTPLSLSGFTMDVTQTDVNYVQATAVFDYVTYSFRDVN